MSNFVSTSTPSSPTNKDYDTLRTSTEIVLSTEETTIPIHTIEPILECALCLNLICEPISISCGHSFCRVCLVNSLRRSKKKCPSCRSICHVVAEDATENIMIKALASTLYPSIYASRSAEMEAEKATWSSLLPIFMMQRVVHTTRSFAYVPNFHNYCAKVGDVALLANLEEAEFLAEGNCVIRAKIRNRYLVSEHFVEEGTQGLHFARLEKLMDSPMLPEQTMQGNLLKSLCVAFIESLFPTHMRSRIEQQLGPMPSSVSSFSLWATMLAPIPDPQKLTHLKSVDTMARMNALVEGFSALLTRRGIQLSPSVMLGDDPTPSSEQTLEESSVEEEEDHK